MSSQLSVIPFGTDATKLAGYAQATERLGNVDMQFNNLDSVNTLSVKVGQFVSGNPSSYTTIVPMFTVAPLGNVTKSLVIAGSKVIGFFGSGNCTANITPTFRNPADLRGADISIFATGKQGWGYDISYPEAAYEPIWPALPDDGP